MPNPTSIGVLDNTGTAQTISTMDALLAIFGAQADAAWASGAGSAMALLKAIATNAISTAPSPVVGPGGYEAVAASAIAQVLGTTGASGDFVSHLLIVPSTTSPGTVQIMDGGSILSAPTMSAPSTATTGGSIAAGTYYGKVTSLGAQGETTGSSEVSQVTTGTTSTITFNFTSVGAFGGRLYLGTGAGGENTYFAVGANATSLTITTATGTAGSVPSTNTATSILPMTVFTGGASSVSNLVAFAVPLGMKSKSGAWKVFTGANVSVIGVGQFT